MQSSEYDFSLLGKILSLIGRTLFTLFVLFTLAAVLFPILAQPKPTVYHTHCLSNMKQIGLGMMMYIQDFDERFPPAYSFHRMERGLMLPVSWGMAYHREEKGKSIEIPGLISPYSQNKKIFRCPLANVEKYRNPFLKSQPAPAPTPERETYMYNDLAATEEMELFANPTETILVAEGEDIERNVGHSWNNSQPPQKAVFNSRGKCPPGSGGTVQNAPTRHNGRANYAFADGHCSVIAPEKIFFPPRSSADISHKGNAPGPDPAGKMVYHNREYKATFHVK